MNKFTAQTEEMLNQLARLVQYNSERGEATEDKPFGEGPAACLAEGLKIAEEMGFRTKNLDNYCGYAEMGEGPEIIGIAAHLDIVPAGDGWDSDSFTLTRKGDKVYGRGVSDDKGAVIASLYAMKAVKDSGIPMHKRVRLLMGCNEETGSRCMAYYNEHEEPITCGFTPDGNFPGIYGEKGMLAMVARSKNTKILEIQGGFVSNAVCHKCHVVIPGGEVRKDALEAALAKTPLVSYSVEVSEGRITIEAQGVAAHASTPQLGVNAAGYTLQALAEAGFKDDFVEFYNEHIGVTNDGVGIGLKVEDEFGPLTLNNGIVGMKDGQIFATIDIRFPVTYKVDQLRMLCARHLEEDQGSIEILGGGEPLFFPPDSDLVTKLVSAYRDVTGDYEHEPEVIGGGTYAKSIPGIIAFGCEFPGADNHIHDANESLPVEELGLQAEIYQKAIENLLA